MENAAQQLDTAVTKPVWETPELTVETVASRTESGVTMDFLDAGSGS